MVVVPPFWFMQRQAKMEPAGPDAYRLTAPNVREAFISIRHDENGRWLAALRQTLDGPDISATAAEFDRPNDAWSAAFELYRTNLIV